MRKTCDDWVYLGLAEIQFSKGKTMNLFPGTMVPPLVKEKTKKEKKKEEEKEKAANDAIKEPREQLKKVPSTRTIKKQNETWSCTRVWIGLCKIWMDIADSNTALQHPCDVW